MILYIFQNCTYFDKKKLREIYEDTQKLEQGVLGTPKIWDRVSPGNLARVSNVWPDWAPYCLSYNILKSSFCIFFAQSS